MKRGALRGEVKWGLGIGLLFAPVALMEGLRGLVGAPYALDGAIRRWLWLLAILLAARLGALQPAGRGRWRCAWRGLALLGATVIVALAYISQQTTCLAWLTLGGLWTWLLVLAQGVWRLAAAFRRQAGRWLARLALLTIASGAGGLIPAIADQIESRFADEEFFVLLQASVLALIFGLILAVHLWLSMRREVAQRDGRGVSAVWLLIGLTLLAVAGGWASVRAYQASFYPSQAPTFDGLSPDSPFLCGAAPSLGGAPPAGEAVLDRLLARVEANPAKEPPEYGMLALGTGEQRWAEAFRASLLDEAAAGRFTDPAHSVKSVQYNAALRLYYLWRVQAAFPALFSEAEQAVLRAWWAAVNARALTVEWVDWNYALAFAKLPEGPYENQENGAGLLALLEVTGYAAPELSAANRAYLARNERGWQARFRNTDDAIIYQPEWIANALFQSFYTGQFSTRQQQLAFEWLLLQSLPDGAILGYNHPARAPLAGAAYLGASLLDDPRLLWLADRSLVQLAATDGYLAAQPGAEAPLNLVGQPPADGSCLLYGDSGLPNQVGPLAPDKIVFRDGWSPQASYALLNLRFTGWHRYKATNALVLLYQGGPLVAERTLGQPFAWLPEGRSLFRDKRIPRENLNGLLVARSGLSAALYDLTGIGGPWAQDPPHYAQVEQFETLGALDVSRTVMGGWRGWQQTRTVYFFHRGPIIVVDEAASQHKSEAAVSWHLVGLGEREDESLWLRRGAQTARLLWPADAWPSVTLHGEPSEAPDQPNLWALYRSPHPDRLDLATVWLTGEWAAARSEMTTLRQTGPDRVLGYYLALDGAAGRFEWLHNATAERLAVEGLATDGQAVAVWQTSPDEMTLCTVGGSQVEAALLAQPAQVTTLVGEPLPPGEAWVWRAGRLVIHQAGETRCLKIR